ncbi:MAG TPA: hypothetical protein PK445_04215 [Methanolinea sp.]|jgi:hypothetical protein|nr:hypothetical protein [Methanolinea sp.]MDI6899424.1 hypothetical protein [Methanolinea sp.]HOS81908.1 hypothetical protein [Methanolinea sp.]HPC54660.1 hypothetical protein [Methanolinea sp.]HQE85625.1 hypothetical protein [Methanolinea sp.]
MRSISLRFHAPGDIFAPLVILCILTLALALSAGCTDERGPRGPVTEPPALLMDYSRTGGIAGFSDRMVIYSDGGVVYQTRQKSGAFTLDQENMERLKRLIRDVEASGLNGTYPAPSQGADYFSYALVFGNRTIKTETTGVPEALSPLISFLDEILAANRDT